MSTVTHSAQGVAAILEKSEVPVTPQPFPKHTPIKGDVKLLNQTHAGHYDDAGLSERHPFMFSPRSRGTVSKMTKSHKIEQAA